MKNCTLLLLFFIPLLLTAQNTKMPGSLVWEKSFGGKKNDNAYSIIPTVDHGFLVVGSSQSNDGQVTGHHGSTDSTDAWVIKLNSNGDLEWQKSYGGSNADEFIHAVQAENGDFICVGTTRSTDGDITGLHTSNGVASDLWVMRINRYGVIQWNKVFGGSAEDRGRVIRKMADGNYMIAGDTRSNDFDVTANNGGADIWVLKINGQGSLIWQKNFGNPNHQHVSSLTVTSDNKYVISGFQTYNKYPTPTQYDLPVYADYMVAGFKIDGEGNVLWQSFPVFWEGNNKPAPFISRIVELPSHELMSVGGTFPAYHRNVTWAMGRITNEFNYDLKRSFGSNSNLGITSTETPREAGPDAVQLLSDSTVLSCITSYGLFSLPIFHINRMTAANSQNGFNALYQTTLGTTEDNLNGIIALQDDEYVAAGRKNNLYVGYNFWIVKVRSLNEVKGKAFLDNNANGIKDANEPYFKQGYVETRKGNSSMKSYLSANGDFSNFTDTGTYTTTMTVNGRPYYTVSPTSQQSTFTSYKNKDSFSFAVVPLPNKNDLFVSLQSMGAVRPGFDADYTVRYSNVGSTTITNTVLKIVKPAVTTLVSSTVPPSSIVADTLTWDLGSLSPFDAGKFYLKIKVNPPPGVNLNDVLSFAATIHPIAGDVTPNDNKDILEQTVRGSMDPNDKQENHNGKLYIEQLQAGEPLTYTVRFQNMGTDTAFNIVIRDTLSNQLDVSTLEIIGASHPYQFNLKDNKYATWTFNNILLPDNKTNEPASHGSITYRIKPRSTLQLGDKIFNSASIYFDFNLPVQTNNHETVIEKTPVPPPPTPVVSGLQLSYCGNLGAQKVKINNLPASTSGITVTAKLDATVLTIAADSTVSFTISTLTAGPHNLTVTYSNVTDTKTTTASFTTTAPATPDVNLTVNISNVVSLANPVIATAVNAGGGGKAPLYTFAWNNSFTNIAQAESSNTLLTIPAASLALGDNKVYVKMRTSENCYTTQENIDSITIRRDMSTGITDTDNPGQAITVYPNPVKGPITIKGLSTGKTYTFTIVNLQGQVVLTKRVANQSTANITGFNSAAGTYWLKIYDEKNGRALGSLQLIRQ